MTRERLELADILRDYTPAFLERYGDTVSAEQSRVLHDLVCCRTAVLGGHLEECDQCGHQRIAYNSCRNRHCPKCQAAAGPSGWTSALELLPVPYFHVVFTLPAVLGLVALQNQRLVYGLLFQAAAQSMLQLARDPQHLGADIGFMAVLHTWGQNLHLHPHVHCVVPGGGISPDGEHWIACRPGFFLPVRAWAVCSVGSSWRCWSMLSVRANWGSTASSRTWRTPRNSVVCWRRAGRPSGSCTPSGLSADPSRS